jgi:hypothetical protein
LEWTVIPAQAGIHCAFLHFGYLVSFKGYAVIASGQWKRSNFFGLPGSTGKKVAVRCSQ